MDAKTLRMACVICFVLCLALAMLAQDASAKNPDQKIAEQTGLGTKEIDKDRLAGKLEIGLAVGSALLAIGVFKWL